MYPEELPATHASPGAHAPPNPLLLVHRYLRGRYWLVAPLALACAVPGAIVGYKATKPQYEAVGRIQIAPSIPLLLDDSDRGGVMPMYDNYINGEAQLAQGQRVIRRALELNEAELVQAGWPSGLAGVRKLSNALTASTQRNTNFIVVKVANEDARLAAAGAKAVIEAYMDLYGSKSADDPSRDKAVLAGVQLSRQQELDDISKQMQAILNEGQFKTDDLDLLQSNFVKRVNDLQFRLGTAQANLSILTATTPEQAEEQAPDQSTLVDDRTLEAAFPEFADLAAECRARRQQLESLSHLSDEHHSKKPLIATLDIMQRRLEEMRERLTIQYLSNPTDMGNPEQIQISRLQQEVEIVQAQLDTAEQQLVRIDAANAKLRKLREREEGVKVDLRKVNADLQGLEINLDRLEQRTVVRDWPDVPVEPTKDRRLPLGVAGAMAGAGGIVAAFVALGFLDRRLRYVDQVEDAKLMAPLLGILPVLNAKGPGQRQIAADSVHHLRNMIEVQLDAGRADLANTLRGTLPCRQCAHELQGLSVRDACPQCGLPVRESIVELLEHAGKSLRPRGRSVVVTSAGAGDGKTSITAALGMSFAASGRRTVVVDADLVGRGLSDALGLLAEPGLAELEAGKPVNGEICSTDMPNLWALPAGRNAGFRPEHVGRNFAASLLRQLEGRFDVVLIDTGPLLGSLEANLAASAADGVLLVVNKDQSTTHVQATLKRLKELGANSLGVVYNRATASDIARSSSAISDSRSARSAPTDPTTRGKSRALIEVMHAHDRPDA